MSTKEEIEEQLNIEKEKSEQLERELQRMHARLKDTHNELEERANEMTNKTEFRGNKTVYVAREKKMARLNGRPVRENDPDVSELFEDVSQHLKIIDDKDAQISFLMDNLGGQAKDEIRLRPRIDRNTPEKILCIIKDVFASSETLGALQQQFFQRDQKQGESLQNYSLSLMKLLDKIVSKDEKAVSNFDEMLKERFIEGICDSSLRREIRRFSFEKKSMSFGEFRQIILQWTEDYKTKPLSKSYSAHEITSQDSIKTSVTKPQEESQLSEILSMLKLQQKQIDENQKQFKLLSDQLDKQKSRSDTKPNSGQGKQFPRVKQPNLTCYRCGGRGHKAPDCSSQVEGNPKKKGKAGSEDPRSPLN